MDGVIRKQMIVNEVIKQYPKTIRVFNRFQIDACCGGARSIEAAATDDGADLEALLAELDAAAREAAAV